MSPSCVMPSSIPNRSKCEQALSTADILHRILVYSSRHTVSIALRVARRWYNVGGPILYHTLHITHLNQSMIYSRHPPVRIIDDHRPILDLKGTLLRYAHHIIADVGTIVNSHVMVDKDTHTHLRSLYIEDPESTGYSSRRGDFAPTSSITFALKHRIDLFTNSLMEHFTLPPTVTILLIVGVYQDFIQQAHVIAQLPAARVRILFVRGVLTSGFQSRGWGYTSVRTWLWRKSAEFSGVIRDLVSIISAGRAQQYDFYYINELDLDSAEIDAAGGPDTISWEAMKIHEVVKANPAQISLGGTAAGAAMPVTRSERFRFMSRSDYLAQDRRDEVPLERVALWRELEDREQRERQAQLRSEILLAIRDELEPEVVEGEEEIGNAGQ
jgi:hypothetical protein